MIEMVVDRVQVSLMSPHRLVVLRDVMEERYLPIWIGQFESDSITIELQGVDRERPLTHDLLLNSIRDMGGQVRFVLINDLNKDIFFAILLIDLNGETIEVDARPSDAIALAVRARVPIYVEKNIMDRASIVPDRDVEEEILGLPSNMHESGDYGESVDESKLSTFADFIDTLNLEDLEDE